ncbi:helix-turn-helix domain-containing protein [Streptomyces sp. CA-251251]|uniref:helix-turn-helix domain-containing protein n=1 Tax=Streptomyces sp. CA-251251 TaxID=3240063 RepID=UPI003D8EB5D7
MRIPGAFSAQPPHLSLSEPARRSGLPVSTVHRMLGDPLVWGGRPGTAGAARNVPAPVVTPAEVSYLRARQYEGPGPHLRHGT